jgi:tRNA threonylcarbamoyl adenosine modification protein (Sua5/YciO/YrdC/YwlC family)
MQPRLLKMWGEPLDPELLGVITRHLKRGGVVAMPTETVYGFSATLAPKPLTELLRMKERGGEKPFLILVPDRTTVSDLTWTPEALELARTFWPGALTLVLRDEGKRYPIGIRSTRGTVAIRQSPHPVAKAVVEALAAPVVSTSANPPGGVPALSAEEALEAARSVGAGPKLWVLDGGRLSASPPSTVVDCSGSEPVVLRVGSIPVNRLRCVVPELPGPA